MEKILWKGIPPTLENVKAQLLGSPDTKVTRGVRKHARVVAHHPNPAKEKQMMSRDRLLHPWLGAKPLSVGHLPSFSFPQVPDGFALCMACWQVITARQLGFERCSGLDPNTLQLVLDPLAPEPQQ